MKDDYSHLIGRRFPGGTTTVPSWENRLWGDSVLGEENTPYVHPVLVYYAGVRGAGVEFQELFDLMEMDEESGVVVGEQRLEFARALEVGATYEVEGEITEVQRKSGARAGVFDMLTFELRLREPGGAQPVATSSNVFIFPRKEAPA